ncbi:MAG: hypothetical protein DRP92_01380 [Candidatus Neomarinimicrobiota bacterium]|nr:MAG: hypothetical protein DRP92_01380 [Candidatus Neomarinimicrobiota bacterium]
MAGDVVIDLIRQGIKTREDIVSNFARTTGLPDIPGKDQVVEIESRVLDTLESISPMNLIKGADKSLRATGLPGLPTLPSMPTMSSLQPMTSSVSTGRTGAPKGEYRRMEGEGVTQMGGKYRRLV